MIEVICHNLKISRQTLGFSRRKWMDVLPEVSFRAVYHDFPAESVGFIAFFRLLRAEEE
ncbi:hypothetical protein [Bacillus marinisedimentorum]|uniref:hypothetical protein n=1 Tax=Bacillus marinisedimentorum TaxID=1821260 RepID=UPI00147232F9|nr:hypothetical protein [Bacillus marinisedimentorum]